MKQSLRHPAIPIRIANGSDIPAMHRVRMAVRENRLSDPARITESDYRAALAELGRTWVVEEGGEIVAFATGYRSGSIWALFVHPDHEGRGYGHALHSTVVGWLWSLGLTRLWLTTSPDTRAERFYVSRGWQPCGHTASGELRLELIKTALPPSAQAARGEQHDMKTPRLCIRPFTLDDAPFILRLLNEPSFIENIADRGIRDLDGARNYLRDGPLASYATHGFGLWRVGLLDSDTAIGMAGLLKRDFLDAIDIGYALLPEYCGMGYAFEATAAALAYAREQLGAKRVVAIVSEHNRSSIHLLQKLGFAADGTVRMPNTDEALRQFACAL